MDIEILYQDDELLVINKPYGIVVNRANTVTEPTIQDWAESKISNKELEIKNNEKEENKDFFDRNGIVHRLDKETSGCLIIAKNPQSFVTLQSYFKNHQVKKEYIALAHGKLEPSSGDINAPIDRLPFNTQKFGVVPGGKESFTHYEVLKFYKKDKMILSLLKLTPTTGRTHQLRVHLKYLGFPIVGDYLYAGRKMQARDRKWCPRVFLHAAKIIFPQPSTQKSITVEAKLPIELEQVLSFLEIM